MLINIKGKSSHSFKLNMGKR